MSHRKKSHEYRVLTTKNRKARELFPSKEEAITFAEDYGFDEAHVELLCTSGMIFESAEVLVNNGKITDAVKTLIAAPRAPDRTRRAMEYLSTGLWQHQSFGMDNSATDPGVVSELLTLADTLRNDMQEPEAQEVCLSFSYTMALILGGIQITMFRARHEADFKALRDLHLKFIGVENYSAALLCLDPVFASTLPSQGSPTVDPEPEFSFYFAYFELLDRLRREDCLDAGSFRQKVFAFQLRQDDRFFVPANSFLHVVFVPKPVTLQEFEEGGCIVTNEELRRALDREIPEYIHLRAKQQNNVYRRRLGAAPCLTTVARGECPKADCQFQHLRPEKITVGWFNARIRLVLKEIQLLNLAGFHPLGVILCALHLAGTTSDSDLI